MSEPVPVHNRPALLMENCTEFDEKNCLVIADLHMGLENELRKKGFRVPSMSETLFSSIQILSGDAAVLIILGDVKHSILVDERYEKHDIVQFLARLSFLFDRVVLVPGNHDGNIAELVEMVGRDNISVSDNRGLVVGDVGLFHGHTWPSAEVMGCKTIVMGHNHPVLAFEDSHGVLNKKEAWLKLPLSGCADGCHDITDKYDQIPDELIILPAFNPYLGGVDMVRDGFLGPFLKAVPDTFLDSIHAFLLDGTYMGELGDIRDSRRDIF